HVVIVVEENHCFSQIIGNTSQAPNINSLAQQGALMTNSFAITHPSQPNYVALFAGSVLTKTNSHVDLSNPNLGRSLLDAGLTFRGYSDSLPSVGYMGDIFNSYARKHN